MALGVITGRVTTNSERSSGGLIVVGGIAGGLASALIFVVLTLVMNPSKLFLNPQVYGMAGMVGAIYGAVLGPLAAWLLMRHVPLWLAIGGTMLGHDGRRGGGAGDGDASLHPSARRLLPRGAGDPAGGASPGGGDGAGIGCPREPSARPTAC
jgi:hypothetical protein